MLPELWVAPAMIPAELVIVLTIASLAIAAAVILVAVILSFFNRIGWWP